MGSGQQKSHLWAGQTDTKRGRDTMATGSCLPALSFPLLECAQQDEHLLPMKVVQESGSAQMLLLITDTSQSKSLWGKSRGAAEGDGVGGGQGCSISQRAMLWRVLCAVPGRSKVKSSCAPC